MRYLLLLLIINLTPTAYNVYSPELVTHNNQLVMLYGGWQSESELPHDGIYKCNPNSCSPAKVISMPQGSLQQVNDPSVVKMPAGYYIMYMTGNTSLTNGLEFQGLYFATSWDLQNWSSPQLLISGYWLPSATMKDGHVYLFAKPTVYSMYQHVFDLGISGVSVGTPVETNMNGNRYSNVDIAYHPSIGLWQMVGENLGINSGTRIDYLYSWDGINFTLGQAGIVEAPAGGMVITPAMHPDTAYYAYFGCSNTNDSLNNQICFKDWSP